MASASLTHTGSRSPIANPAGFAGLAGFAAVVTGFLACAVAGFLAAVGACFLLAVLDADALLVVACFAEVLPSPGP